MLHLALSLIVDMPEVSPPPPIPPPATLFDLSALLSYWNILLIVAVWATIQTLRRALPHQLTGDGPLVKIVPAMPILGCMAAMWVPGPWIAAGEPLGQRIVLGIVLGAVCSNFHAIASKFGLHDLLKLEVEPDEPKPVLAAVPGIAPELEPTGNVTAPTPLSPTIMRRP